MQRRRWRWLWIWFGVLVAGCGQFWSSNSTPPPSREPTLPLWGYTLLPPTLTPGVWPARTATPLITVDSTGTPVALSLIVSGAACYETPVGSLVCLGQVRNPLDVPVEQVRIAVQLLDKNGLPLVSDETTMVRWVLPPGESAPYRIVFQFIPIGYAGSYATISGGQIAQDVERRFASLTLHEVSGRFLNDENQVNVSVLNSGTQPVEEVTVTMTLLDARGQVTGFRQMVLPTEQPLMPGQSRSLTIRANPQGANAVSFEVFAEGRFSRN